MGRIKNAFLGVALACAASAGLVPAASAGEPQAYKLSGAFWGTHDPSIARDGDTWYVFATGKAPGGGQFAVRCSKDLKEWKLCGQVFDAIPDWIQKDSPGTKELWAPDVSYYHGRYQMYYAYSLFGKNTSGIGLAVNKTLDPKNPDYKWEDRGLVLKSLATDDYNAIDPNFIVDGQGGTWLAFGSFWTGIKMRRLDPSTGLASKTDTRVYALATRARPAGSGEAATKASAEGLPDRPSLPPDWEAIEAPFIVHHGSYYYLFVSWDLCCRGTKSTYRTMVGRSKSVTGPYIDAKGVPMMQGGGTQLLLPNQRWLGPGGESVLMGGGPGGHDLIVFHAYDAKTGKPALQVSTIAWVNGWPKVALGD